MEINPFPPSFPLSFGTTWTGCNLHLRLQRGQDFISVGHLNLELSIKPGAREFYLLAQYC